MTTTTLGLSGYSWNRHVEDDVDDGADVMVMGDGDDNDDDDFDDEDDDSSDLR